MSFTHFSPAPARLQRSVLAIPASDPALVLRALRSAADQVFLDCEDAPTRADPPRARDAIVHALRAHDWHDHGKSVGVRINGLDTHFMYRDLVDIVEQAGERIDTVLVPRTGVPADVYVVDCLLTQIESARGLPRRIGIEAAIETALGMTNVETIARASPRLEALHFGGADFTASCQARSVSIGALNPDYPGDQWHASLQRLLVACRAHGLRAIDGPYGDVDDSDGFVAAARRAAALGFEGKWTLSPGQIVLANQVMAPPADDVAHARRILAALEEAARGERAAAHLDGRTIDAASARMAETLVRQAAAIAARSAIIDRE
ncbi:MAG: CoA ester lyase [Gammaproteobacteria bacterium]